MNITDLYIRQLRDLEKINITDTILHQVKRCLLDYIAVTYAGSSYIGNKLDDIRKLGTNGPCSILGKKEKSDIHTATIMNGFAAHAMELDDGHRFGMLHLEATIITAMFAVAQKEKLLLEQFIKGILIGYEASVRLATAIQPVHKQNGFHATGTCGTIGVACGIGFALGLNNEQLKGALSSATTSAAGLLALIDDNSELKPYNVANAASNGITAAYMGKCGFNGPFDILGGKRGFFKTYMRDSYLKEVSTPQNSLVINQIYVKPYAACRHCHAPIECALILKRQNNILPKEIDSIEVQTYKLAIDGHEQINISGCNEAKMSIPYSVAVSLVLGSCGIEAFMPDMLVKEDIINLTKKVHIVENKHLTKASPQKRGAIVIIRLFNGKCYSKKIMYPLGEPENKVSDTQLEEKYESLMSYSGVSESERTQIKNIIWNLENNYNELIML